jgi:hypothetical protein
MYDGLTASLILFLDRQNVSCIIIIVVVVIIIIREVARVSGIRFF